VRFESRKGAKRGGVFSFLLGERKMENRARAILDAVELMPA